MKQPAVLIALFLFILGVGIVLSAQEQKDTEDRARGTVAGESQTIAPR
jgi:hypothetical protein